MNRRILNHILQQLTELSVDTESTADVLLCYLYAHLNIHYSSQPTALDGINTHEFSHAIEKYNFTNTLPDYIHDVRFTAFCRSLVDFHLDTNYKTFLEFFAPRLISQWDLLQSELVNLSVIERLITIYVALKGTNDLALRFEDIGKPEIASIYNKYAPLFNGILHVDSEVFLHCWQAIFYTPMPKLKKTLSKNLITAIRFYRTHKISGYALLKNYCQYNSHKTKLDEAFNPWLDFERAVKNNAPLSGVSITETAFNLVQKLSKETPSDIIRAAIYPYPELFGRNKDLKVKSRNDNRFECSFLLQEFEKIAKISSSILIVNPGPDFLVILSEHLSRFNCKCTIAVPNIYFASAYRLQFPEFTFCIFSDLEASATTYDFVAVISTQTEEDINLHNVFSACRSSGHLIALLPQTLLTKGNSICNLLQSSALSVNKIISIAPNATVTTPSKKMLVFAQKSENQPSVLPVFFTQCDLKADNLILEKEYIRISPDQLEKGHTLNQIRQSVLTKKQATPVKFRNKALVYSFSDEIKIQYTIHIDKLNYYVGSAHYKALTRPDKKRKSVWDSTITQKGLRSKERGSVIASLEATAYYEQFAPNITGDLLAFYAENFGQCSLKTIWFCCRDALRREHSYDDLLAQTVLFPNTNAALSSIHPCDASEDDYRQAMASVIPDSSHSIVKYWQQLNLIFKTAVGLKYLHSNPIPPLLSEVSNQASTELTILRNALTKKTFTAEEEERIVDFLSESTNVKFGSRKAKRYEAESIWLLGAIRLFTGMSIREACALTWGDFVKIQTLGSYQLQIYKFLQDDGSFSYTTDRSTGKFSYRKIPIPPVLADMLLNRLAFIKETLGFAKNELKSMPIILSTEMVKSDQPSFCKYADAVKACRKVIETAKIPPQELTLPGEEEIIVDMNKYLGDIFYANFKHRANHTCSFLRGELAYVLGNKGPDTFSQHYCDYSNDMLQYSMTQKLRRWTWKYEHQNCSQPVLSKNVNFLGRHTFSSEINKQHYNCIDITLTTQQTIPGSYIEIEIDCDHGLTGTVTVLPKGD